MRRGLYPLTLKASSGRRPLRSSIRLKVMRCLPGPAPAGPPKMAEFVPIFTLPRSRFTSCTVGLLVRYPRYSGLREVRKNIQKIGDSTITQYNAIAELNLKAVNMKTGEILFSDSDEESVTEKGASVPGYEMAVSPPSLDRPLKIAVQRLADKFIGTMKTN